MWSSKAKNLYAVQCRGPSIFSFYHSKAPVRIELNAHISILPFIYIRFGCHCEVFCSVLTCVLCVQCACGSFYSVRPPTSKLMRSKGLRIAKLCWCNGERARKKNCRKNCKIVFNIPLQHCLLACWNLIPKFVRHFSFLFTSASSSIVIVVFPSV